MRRNGVAVILAFSISACTTMRPVESPATFLEQNNPRQIRLHDAQNELYVLNEPQLRGDTIVGYESLVRSEMRISVAGVRRMEALQRDNTKTGIFIGAMTVLGAAGIYMIAKAADGQKLVCDSYDTANRCVTQPQAIRIPVGIRK